MTATFIGRLIRIANVTDLHTVAVSLQRKNIFVLKELLLPAKEVFIPC